MKFLICLKVAAIIPAHNEEKVIRNAIIALLLAGMKSCDIYVINDASTDRTAEIAKESGVNMLSLLENAGKASALKQGIEYFRLGERYDYLIFLDADTKVHGNCVKNFIKAAKENPNVALFVGQVKAGPGTYISSYRAVEYAFGQDLHKSGQSKHGLVFIAPGCASMYHSGILSKLKFENDTLAEDMDLTMQVQRQKQRIVYVPEAMVYTQDPRNIKDYIKQITRWQRGVWQVIKKHRVMAISKKQAVDWMIIFLAFDAIINSRLIWIAASLIVLPFKIARWFPLLDIAFFFSIAIYAAFKNRRLDTLYKFPIYFWLGYLNSYIFIKSFLEVMILKKEVMRWNKVLRY